MCPLCQDLKGKDNLKYNVAKNVLHCFADPSHAPLICKEIYKKNLPVKRNHKWNYLNLLNMLTKC